MYHKKSHSSKTIAKKMLMKFTGELVVYLHATCSLPQSLKHTQKKRFRNTFMRTEIKAKTAVLFQRSKISTI